MCGVWHNRGNHFVFFYLCPEFWTIIDPLHSVTSPDPHIASNIATALTTTYLYHNLPVSPLPSFRRVNRVSIQNDFPQAPWACITIAILTAFHLTLRHIRPDTIHKASTNRRQYLTFHQSLLQRLILGTPSNVWNLACIHTHTHNTLRTNQYSTSIHHMRSRASTSASHKDPLYPTPPRTLHPPVHKSHQTQTDANVKRHYHQPTNFP